MFIDRQYTGADHLEVYCISCGTRVFFHPPSASQEGKWLLRKEQLRAKSTITNL